MFAVRMLLIPLSISVFLGTGFAQAAPGKIEEVAVGTLVKVSRSGTVVRLKKGDELKSGDEVATDANTAVDIRLEDDTLIRIGINSAYRIQEDSKINSLIHRLLSGAVRVLVPKSETKSNLVKFRLYTPEGTIGVRGTEFVVIRSEGKTQLRGLDGTVMFGPGEADFANEAAFVSVGRGFQSSVEAGAKTAAKPEKFDLPKYLLEIASKGSFFAPLAARVEGTKTHLRASNEKPFSLGTTPSVAKNEPKNLPANSGQSRPSGAKDSTDFNRMLLDGALNGEMQKVKEAVAKGADLNSVDTVGYTALQVVLSKEGEKDAEKFKEIFKFLIEKGADVNVKDKEGKTPLMLVAEHHYDMEYAEALVDPGAVDLSAKDRKGRLVDEIAKEAGYTELHKYLSSEEVVEDNNRAIKARDERNQSDERNQKKKK